jgi:KipI family sensor histidine kinase inhibitor
LPTGAAWSVEPLGERALLVRHHDADLARANRAVHALARRIDAQRPVWLEDRVPAYASLALIVRADAASAATLAAAHRFVATQLPERDLDVDLAASDPMGREVRVPVRYGGPDGPDLEATAAACGLDPVSYVQRHCAGRYTVAMLGFAPGFAYLLGLDPALAAPRLATPRRQVPAGSVGIAGAQTGIYPQASPGGWRLIGRTELTLFDPARDPPSLLQPGDRVRFVALDAPPEPPCTSR